MKSNLVVKTSPWSSWIIVPLRLFLGVTFLYAGIQKLTDPQYFNPAARGYIGHQIISFAQGSPLRGFLLSMAAPHAVLFGGLVAYGELAIGLGVLVGLLLRVAALSGLFINLVLFLSAGWHIFPYFYGSDIVFLFCWLTLLLAGPANQVLPALDTRLVKWLVGRAKPEERADLAGIYAWFFGVRVEEEPLVQVQQAQGKQVAVAKSAQKSSSSSQYRAWQFEQLRKESRRNFVIGSLTGGAVVLVLGWVAETLRLLPRAGANVSEGGVSAVEAGTPAAAGTPPTVSPNGVIAQISSVPANSATTFTLASNGDPGVLVHLNDGQFVAFDSVCTHAGCPVDYDPSSQQLVCPCHGASFDPAKNAEVTNGPAQTPLANVPIKVDQSAGTIIMQ